MEGSKFKQLSVSQERLVSQREELERQRKSLSKRRPLSGGPGGAGAGSRSSSPAQLGKCVKPQLARSVAALPTAQGASLPR